MTPTEYRAILRTLNLTQQAAAIWLGVSQRTGQNYASKGPTEPVARLLQLALDLGLDAEYLVASAAEPPVTTMGGIDRASNPF